MKARLQKINLLLSIFILTIISQPLNGQINFSDYTTLGSGSGVQDCKIADMNNDGLEDLIMVNSDFSSNNPNINTIFIYHQTPDNAFVTTPIIIDYDTLNAAGDEFIVIADMDNNGLNDIIMNTAFSIAIYYQESIDNYSLIMVEAINHLKFNFDIGDLNNDGLFDITYSPQNEKYMTVAYQQPDESFVEWNYPTYQFANFYQVEIHDLNDDGLDDLIYGNGVSTSDSIYYNIQLDTGLQIHYKKFFVNHDHYVTGDINNDGLVDILTEKGNGSDSEISIWLQNPDSNLFEYQYDIPANWDASEMELADLNCDGFVDLVVAYSGGSNFYVYRGSELGFSAYTEFDMNFNAGELALGDTNNDRFIDVHIGSTSNTFSGGVFTSRNSSTPKLTDYQFTDTLTTITTTLDTTLTENIFIETTQDTTDRNCLIVTVDSILIQISIIQTSVLTEFSYYLEAEMCGLIFNDSLLVTSIQNSVDSNHVDSTLISTTIFTITPTPQPSDFIVTDTIIFNYLTVDTVYEYNNYILITEDINQPCPTLRIDSFQVITTLANSILQYDTTYTLEASLCDSIFTDSIVIVNIQNSTELLSVDTMLISSILDTLTTTILLNQETIIDTIFQDLIYRDSMLIVTQNQYETGDTLFTITDSLLTYQVSGLYNIETFQYEYNEITGCGISVLDTTLTTSSFDTILFINFDTLLISRIISFDIINAISSIDFNPLNVYPNPTNNWCIVKLPEQIQQLSFQVKIVTSDGKVILEERYTNGLTELRFDLSEYSSDIYSITLISANGSVFQNFIVVQ